MISRTLEYKLIDAVKSKKENNSFCKKEVCKHFYGSCDSPLPIIGCKLRKNTDIQMFANGLKCGDYEAVKWK